MIAAALLLCWTISSEDIGEFFTIPDWCPSSVPSSATFGSQDNYIEMWSNDVYTTHWKVLREGVDVTDVISGQPSWDEDEGGWNVEQAIDERDTQHGFHEYVPPESKFVGSSEKDDHISYYSYLFNPFPPPGGEDTVNYEAVADGFRTNRIFLGYAPKASRLTPQWLAATYAPFDAFCERSYYFSEGQESDWDVGLWGPAEPLTDFSFAEGRYSYQYPFHPDTNRTVRSRRLVEHDNFVNLYNSLTYLDPYDKFMLERPGWGLESYAPVMFGSTVIEKSYPDFRELPEFSWNESPETVLTSNQWQHVAVTFDDFPDNGDMRFQGSWWRVPYHAFTQLNFGEYPFYSPDDMIANGLGYDKSVEWDYTAYQLMTNFFKIGDKVVFRLDWTTRRLDMNDYAAADQMLAALDVTYNRATPEYWGCADSARGIAEANFSFSDIQLDDLFWTYDEGEGAYVCGLSEDYNLSGLSMYHVAYTNYAGETWHALPHVFTSPSGSTFNFSSSCENSDAREVATCTREDVTRGLAAHYSPRGSGTYTTEVGAAYVGHTLFRMEGTDDMTGERFAIAYAEATLADAVTVKTQLKANRNYTWEKTRSGGFTSFGVHHPGNKGWDISDVKLWSCLAYMSAQGNDDSEVDLAEVFYGPLTKSTMYKADLADVASLYATTNEMNSQVDSLISKMDEEMRSMVSGYDSPESVIPIEESHLSSMCAHSKYDKDSSFVRASGLATTHGINYEFEARTEYVTITNDAPVSEERRDITIDVSTNGVQVSTTNYVVVSTNFLNDTATNYVSKVTDTNATEVTHGFVVVEETHDVTIDVTATNGVHVSTTNYVTTVTTTNELWHWVRQTNGVEVTTWTNLVNVNVKKDIFSITMTTNDYAVTTNFTVTSRTVDFTRTPLDEFDSIVVRTNHYPATSMTVYTMVCHVGEDGEVDSAQFVLPDGSLEDIPDEVTIGSMTYSIGLPVTDSSYGPTWTECRGASCVGKFDFWTKVKWNWKALRLNTDE